MNIIFNDQELFENLKNNALFSIEFGSKLYGINNEFSDTDLLYIIADQDNSLVWDNHQLQFKEKDIDHIFVSLKTFIRNLLTGDSTVNYEIITTEEFKKSELFSIFENTSFFNNYNLNKSYLGLAKRDIENAIEELTKNNKINYKKISHAYRGLVTAKLNLQHTYSNDFKQDLQSLDIIKKIKNQQISIDVEFLKKIHIEIEAERQKLNQLFQNKKIDRVMDLKKMNELEKRYADFIKNKNYEIAKNNNKKYSHLYFEVLEFGLKY